MKTKTIDLDPNVAVQAIQSFFNPIMKNNEGNKDSTHRYLSWEFCYKAFQKVFNETISDEEKKKIDELALHLGFYLASWGNVQRFFFLVAEEL